jgi:DNA-binding transcriptional regulator YiaG
MRKTDLNPQEIVQQTINERLKYLIDSLKISARAFSATLQVPESNTRNYLDKNTKLNSDYLERISRNFKSVNLNWLITGEGEPFLSLPNENEQPTENGKKFFRSPFIGNNQGTANQQQHVNSASDAELTTKLTLAEKEIEHLRTQLKMQDALLASKEETISLLRDKQNRPT